MIDINASDARRWQPYSYAFGALVLLACLTLTFFNTLGLGFSSYKAPALLGWFCASVATACLVLFTKKEKTNWAALLFLVLFLFIVVRQGPQPIHSTALGLIVLTMACAAHSASLFARVSSWAFVLAGAVVLVALLNALVALYQYFGFSAQFPIPYIETTPIGSAIGQVRQRNQMATLCVLGLVTLAYFPVKFRWASIARFGVGVCLIAAVAASASRIGAAAILLFSCTLIFTFRSLPRSSQQLVGLSFPIFLVLAYLLPALIEDQSGLVSRLTDDAFAVPCNSRLLLWKNTISLIWQSPFAGAGWGGFIGKYYTSDLPVRGCELLDHAHNVYLNIAVEAGVIVAALLIIASIWFFFGYWRTVAADSIYRWAYFSVAIIWLYAQTDFPLWVTGFLWLFAIFLGLITTRESKLVHHPAYVTLSRLLVTVNPWFIVVMALATACLSAIALIQYFRVSHIATPTEWDTQIAKRGYQELVKENWMFADHLEFVAAQMQEPTKANAEKINKLCTSVIPYSPEPPIIMCVIKSAYLMGDMKQVEFHKQRLVTTYGSQVDMYKEELDSFK